jgi:anti-anti-sigma factor
MPRTAPPVLRSVDGVLLVELGEDYSHLHEDVLQHLQILPLVAESIEPARMVVDMANVKFIGSAVIGQLLATSQKLSARGGTFGLIHANQFCRTVLNLARMSELIPNYESLHAASEQWSKSPVENPTC